MIIDIHMHIGDILEPNGRDLIDKTGIRYPIGALMLVDDALLYSRNAVTAWLASRMHKQVTREERARNAAGTMENCRRMLDQTAAWDRKRGGDGRVLACVQPIAPYVSHQDAQYAASLEPRLLPWACPDFTLPLADMLADVASQQALGMKIHPIIQCVSWQDERVLAVLSRWHKPVLVHTGFASYYPPAMSHRQQSQNSDPQAAARTIAMFPNIPFIIGHAGIFEMKEWADACAKYDNTYVDASFHQPSDWRWLTDTYGSRRVMYASDWPYGRASTSLRAAAAAFKGEMLERVLWQNAWELMDLGAAQQADKAKGVVG